MLRHIEGDCETAYFSLVSIFTYHLIIIQFWFCKFGLVNLKMKCGLHEISVGENKCISQSSSTCLNCHHIPWFGYFSHVLIFTGADDPESDDDKAALWQLKKKWKKGDGTTDFLRLLIWRTCQKALPVRFVSAWPMCISSCQIMRTHIFTEIWSRENWLNMWNCRPCSRVAPPHYTPISARWAWVGTESVVSWKILKCMINVFQRKS